MAGWPKVIVQCRCRWHLHVLRLQGLVFMVMVIEWVRPRRQLNFWVLDPKAPYVLGCQACHHQHTWLRAIYKPYDHDPRPKYVNGVLWP